MNNPTTRQRLELALSKAMTGYQWNARQRRSPIILEQLAMKLLLAEHRRLRAKVRKLKDYAEPHDMKRRALYLEVIDDVLKVMR